MNVLSTILFYVGMLIIILALYAICRMYVFSKVRINKWIPLAIAVVLFCVQLFVKGMNGYLNTAVTICTVLFLLWFMEIQQTGGPKKKEKVIKIKPKAKPNRVKNNKKDK
ncbi:hypothetical protein [uncultured Clostridium sp.]|uniref:hypothetical protein n=1 Tax=uncultured Clostridium sp. TaxID=59620 RepID=UPI0025DAF8F3|nr:hypothetical protein [uncultured Clostridium sp.]